MKVLKFRAVAAAAAAMVSLLGGGLVAGVRMWSQVAAAGWRLLAAAPPRPGRRNHDYLPARPAAARQHQLGTTGQLLYIHSTSHYGDLITNTRTLL